MGCSSGMQAVILLFLPHSAPSRSVQGLSDTWREVQGQQKKKKKKIEICLKEESEPGDS